MKANIKTLNDMQYLRVPIDLGDSFLKTAKALQIPDYINLDGVGETERVMVSNFRKGMLDSVTQDFFQNLLSLLLNANDMEYLGNGTKMYSKNLNVMLVSNSQEASRYSFFVPYELMDKIFPAEGKDYFLERIKRLPETFLMRRNKNNYVWQKISPINLENRYIKFDGKNYTGFYEFGLAKLVFSSMVQKINVPYMKIPAWFYMSIRNKEYIKNLSRGSPNLADEVSDIAYRNSIYGHIVSKGVLKMVRVPLEEYYTNVVPQMIRAKRTKYISPQNWLILEHIISKLETNIELGKHGQYKFSHKTIVEKLSEDYKDKINIMTSVKKEGKEIVMTFNNKHKLKALPKPKIYNSRGELIENLGYNKKNTMPELLLEKK